MENDFDLEDLLVCPYNKAHSIRRPCMSTHLTKCRRNYPNSKKIVCEFNVEHIVPAPELQYHHNTCPNRKHIELPVKGALEQRKSKFPISDVQVSGIGDWDDINSASYDPQEYVENNNVLQNFNVKPRSERKLLQSQQRQKVSMANNAVVPQEKAPTVGLLPKLVQLPPARQRNDVSDNTKTDKNESIKDAIKRGGDKLYMQHENNPSNSN